MRVAVLGATGMLGHKLAQVIGAELETVAVVRTPDGFPAEIQVSEVIGGLDAMNPDKVADLLGRIRPDVVLNAVGIVKQSEECSDRARTIAINALFPNRLAALCSGSGIRLVHYSTDCVFSGESQSRRGPHGYRESDPADARDLYGLSKLLGEPEDGRQLVLRTSMIGRELRSGRGLVEWFLNRKDAEIPGYTNALFTGLTTLELARLTLKILTEHPSLRGMWHVAADPVSKHDLLNYLRDAYRMIGAVTPEAGYHCDRRLDGRRFSKATGWHAPSWPILVREMRDDPFPYANHERTLVGGNV